MFRDQLHNENKLAIFGMHQPESTTNLFKSLEDLDEPIVGLSTAPKALITTLMCVFPYRT